MNGLSNYTTIEILKFINEIKSDHEKLKEEITQHTYDVEEMEKNINDKLENLNDLEKNYIILIEEFSKREE